MTNDLARWQFATTTIYHFLFVPVTIGLAFLVAVLQTVWYRTDNPDYKRMTRFFGTLLLINVAIGVVTGLVQEFQFGMNWSVYSRYVGSVFGAPLAMEGLLAFFLESTFIGLWLFGWDRLPKRVHLATIWAVAAGSMLSAMFILMANSWMQHPVGYKIDKAGNAVMTNIWAMFVNPTFVWGYAHVILASLVTGCLVMLAVSAWYLRKGEHVESFHRTAKVALIVLIPTIVIQLSVGNQLGEVEAHYQPMKIAAAEAQWNNCKPCSFSVAQIGGGSATTRRRRRSSRSRTCCRSWRPGPGAAGSPGSTSSRRSTRRSTARELHPERVHPVLVDAGDGRPRHAGDAVGAVGRVVALPRPTAPLEAVPVAVIWAVVTPFLMNTAGWLLTESGRQPWVVQGLLKTVNANSPSVSSTDIWISLIAFVLAYIVLGAADLILMLRYSRHGLAASRRRGRRHTGRSASPLSPTESMQLHTIWFIIIAIFWVGFFVLEGFDFGVGVLHRSSAGPRPSGASRSTRSARGGTATRYG